MIDIYKAGYDCGINEFYGRESIKRNEVILKEKIFNSEKYIYAEPNKKGSWAFGGNILYTSNGIYPEFTTPIKLHDRNMLLEV